MIYFVKAIHSGAIKIGFSNDPKSRLASLQTGSYEPLELLGVIPGQIADERRLHGEFAKHRICGEWFKGHPDLIKCIDRLLRPSLEDVLRETRPDVWHIDGIARLNDDDAEASLICVIRGKKPVLPDPNEMLSAVLPDYKYVIIFSVQLVLPSVDGLEDTDSLRAAITDEEHLTWVCRLKTGNRFVPLFPSSIEKPKVAGHPTDSLVVGSSVLHPQYGIGRVKAIWTSDAKRMGRIAFTIGGEKNFDLTKSPLRPCATPNPLPQAEQWQPEWMKPSNS